jgi:outer membrane protein assembly factor BamB
MQTPIFVNGRIYACRDSGILSCFDFKNGKRLFEERVAHLPRGYTASPVSDGRHLYICSEQGEIIVVPATDTFSVSAVNELNEICMATPAISNGLLLFRTRNSLIAVGSKPF